MKLDKKTQLAIVGVLILLISFAQPPYSMKQAIGTGIGKAAALAAVAYIWMHHSKLIALFLVIWITKCSSGVWEGLTCPPGQEEQGGVCVEKKKEAPAPPPAVSAPPMTVPGVGTPVSSQSSSTAVQTAPAQPLPPVAGPQPTEKFDLMHAYPLA